MACNGKVRYETEVKADIKVWEMWALLGREGNASLMPYPCNECLGWHVGHSDRRESSALKEKKWADDQAKLETEKKFEKILKEQKYIRRRIQERKKKRAR